MVQQVGDVEDDSEDDPPRFRNYVSACNDDLSSLRSGNSVLKKSFRKQPA